MLSASTLKPSSLVISNLKCGCSLLVGNSSSSSVGGGGSSSEVEAAPNKTDHSKFLRLFLNTAAKSRGALSVLYGNYNPFHTDTTSGDSSTIE